MHGHNNQNKYLFIFITFDYRITSNNTMEYIPFTLDLRVPDMYSSYMTHTPRVVIIDPILTLFFYIHFYFFIV